MDRLDIAEMNIERQHEVLGTLITWLVSELGTEGVEILLEKLGKIS
tara:strand:- start:3753 stop:3890 length:138 start_codon:yes stop_codon:yes gene_type:complete